MQGETCAPKQDDKETNELDTFSVCYFDVSIKKESSRILPINEFNNICLTMQCMNMYVLNMECPPRTHVLNA